MSLLDHDVQVRSGKTLLLCRVESESLCRSCGAEILWAKTPYGKPIPLDPPADEEEADRGILETHFATCPQGKAWSGTGRGKEGAPA